jgi:hypothetical protein
MLTLSKPISAGQAQAYHKSEFANAKENYYTKGERVRGEWQGQLATRYGLRGEVNEEQFARLSEGQHPATGEALIRRQQAREYINDKGETARTMEHRVLVAQMLKQKRRSTRRQRDQTANSIAPIAEKN